MKIGRKNHFLGLLHHRQLGMSKCSSVSDFYVLKSLFTKTKGREYAIIGGCPIIFHGDARYGDGKMIIKDPNTKEMVCYDLRAGPRPRELWRASSHPRWEDHLIVSAPLPSHLRPPLPHAAHRPYLLVLRADNVLQRYGLVTGWLEQEISLQAATVYGLKHRFTEMVPDMERGWLVLSSIKVRKPKTDGVLKCFLILEFTTLQILHKFEVSKLTFGNSMQDANIFGGLLLILHNIGCSKIEMFSIDDVMSLPNRHPAPPCLYSVATSHHHLELNMAPWLYIRATSQHNFSLHQLADQGRVAGGDFPLAGGGAEEVEHQLEFCPDHPSRLMHYGHFGLRVYHMENQGPGTATTLHLEFQCQPPSAEEKSTSIMPLSVNRHGRKVKKPPNYFEKMSDSVDHVLYDYENELNIFGVLFYKETLDEDTNSQIVHVSHIDLYDSYFKHLRKIPLDILHQRSNMDLSNKISFVMDQDLILITLKNAAKSLLYILRNFDVEDMEKL